MPTNITQGDNAEFIVQFLDASGVITVPAGATLTIVYPVGTFSTGTAIIAMVLNSFEYVATWNSGVSSFGLANWSILGLGGTNAAQGQLNIIDP